MTRVLGIDPGTKSFDICGLDDGHVYFERVIDTTRLVEGPEPMMQAIEEASSFDLIVGPSGYGVEVTYLWDIDNPGEFMRAILLLLRKEDFEASLARHDLGIMVYAAMIKLEVQMKKRELPVCYIPSVIQLPTVPSYRKVNKIDMGTVDKACAAVLGIQDQAKRLDIPYSETSFILIESGFGYNAVIGVEQGRIVDGIGGTTGGPGFLTIGAMDAELAAIVGRWEKADIFTGGGISISGRSSLEEIGDKEDDVNSRMAWDAIIEGVEKGVASMTVSVSKPREILLSGRWARTTRLKEELTKRLSKFGSVRSVGWLEDATKVKEAAQGYAMVADGLSGGKYAELIRWMKVREAKGTALDYIYHPKGKSLLRDLAPWFKSR
jgi:predicted butyrate kinase (DUF1464 family)